MNYKIQRLKLEDFPRFYKTAKSLIIDQFPHYPPNVRQQYWQVEFNAADLKKEIKSKRILILTALNGTDIIGFIYTRIDNGGGVECLWLIINEKYRHQGIGSRLLREVEKIVLKRKSHFIFLHTETQENIAFKFIKILHLCSTTVHIPRNKSSV